MNFPRVQRKATRAVQLKCPLCGKVQVIRFIVSDDATQDEQARMEVVRACPHCKEEIAYEVDARLDKDSLRPEILSARKHNPPPDDEADA